MITIFEELKQEMGDLKQQMKDMVQVILELKTIVQVREYAESFLENPFDELVSFGFKAKSLQEVSTIFCVVKAIFFLYVQWNLLYF